jgi:type IV pilus assembly protein PilC
LLDELVFHIKNGSSLSASLMHYPQDFSEAEIGMIKAGETSGKLNITLINIADQLEKSAGITKKIKGAMIYPATIFLVMIVAFFLVMTFVIPQIKDMFDSFDAELPWMTQILIDFSDFLQATDPIFGFKNVINVLILSIILGVSFLVFKKTKRGRILLDYFIFYIPLFGSLVKKMCITKMTRGLSTLLSSGISIVKALKVNSDMIGNEKYKKRILRMAEDVKIGINISDNIKNDYEYFPSMVISMIGVGEQTANLHKITLKIAEMYEEDIDEFVKTLSSIIEPVIIVIVGLAVGFLVIAVMMPILSLSDLAG